ncbi:MAG: HEAT repeat domain-containing protein, partial [Planctomycetales bacterium]|nr:HEAT repeat domain-containing protein [Planctomycetales bacterium]
PEVRARAAAAAGRLKSGIPVGALGASLDPAREADARVRRAVARALGELGDPALAPLARGLGDTDAEVRWAAAYALGLLADPGAAEALVAHLAREVEPEVREAAVVSLGKHRRARALDSVIGGLVRATGDAAPRVATAAAAALLALGGTSGPTLARIGRALEAAGRLDGAAETLEAALAAHGDGAEPLPAAEVPALRDAVADLWARAGKPDRALAALRKAWDEAPTEERAARLAAALAEAEGPAAVAEHLAKALPAVPAPARAKLVGTGTALLDRGRARGRAEEAAAALERLAGLAGDLPADSEEVRGLAAARERAREAVEVGRLIAMVTTADGDAAEREAARGRLRARVAAAAGPAFEGAVERLLTGLGHAGTLAAEAEAALRSLGERLPAPRGLVPLAPEASPEARAAAADAWRKAWEARQ